jgi:hypothetical protein
MRLNGLDIRLRGRSVKTARIENEFLRDVEDPASLIRDLKGLRPRPDLFTFWQRFPDTTPRYPYHLEWDNWAVLSISSYDQWFRNQISGKIRAKIRRAPKTGVEIKVASLDDDFIAGVTRIFNETPLRQGKRFAHFGKTFEQVGAELRSESERTVFIGAYYQGELIGFTQQVYAGACAFPYGGVSLVAHRDKSPNNALLAKAVEVCSEMGMKFMIYGFYDYGTGESGLTDFKVQNGFQKVLVPRYYVPLTLWGGICLRLGLHHGLKKRVPPALKRGLIGLRKKWYARSRDAGSATSSEAD